MRAFPPVLAASIALLVACASSDATNEPGTGDLDASPGDTPRGPSTNGSELDAATSPCDLSKPFGAPTDAPFAEINTASSEASPYLTPDELTVYFATYRDSGELVSYDLYRATRPSRDVPFGKPEKVPGKINEGGGTEEHTPVLSADETTLFFSKQKSGATNDYDVWFATRANATAEWSAGQPVPGINTQSIDIANDVLNGELWFHTGMGEVYRVPKKGNGFDTPIAVPELGEAYDVHLSRDGLRIFYSHLDDQRMSDIWTATRPDTSKPFEKPEVVANINSPADDTVGWLSHDGCRMYLHSDRSGNVDLHFAARPR